MSTHATCTTCAYDIPWDPYYDERNEQAAANEHAAHDGAHAPNWEVEKT